MTGQLWSSHDLEAWQRALLAYPRVVQEQPSALLHRLDAWYREELPAALVGREPPYLTPRELVQVVEWKMARGVWRPRNLQLARANDEAAVYAASQEAFRRAPDPAAPLRVLGRLKGVGPATASAVLAAWRPDLYPFFDDVVAAQLPGMEIGQFTLPAYQRYAATLRGRAELLGAPWTAQQTGLALWSAAGGKLSS
ncbi:MAG: hypothetical protein IT307_04890 [Chloroflexi bacterium]|nr:hypothetical protein [Chloroflexota bacterium]